MNTKSKHEIELELKNKDEYYYNLIKENIKKCRRYFDLTQEQLAEKINTEVKYYSHLEQKRHCPLHILGNISDIMQIPISTFFTENLPFPKQDFNIPYHNNNHYYDVVRKNIRKIRKFNGMSQKNLSININRGKDYISELENGNKKNGFPIATIVRVSSILSSPIENFFEEEVPIILEHIN